jgi:hypothetical protein
MSHHWIFGYRFLSLVNSHDPSFFSPEHTKEVCDFCNFDFRIVSLCFPSKWHAANYGGIVCISKET